jgi:hypothetical protein
MLRRTAEIRQPASAQACFTRCKKHTEDSMSLQTHLAELERKHQALESALADAVAHPSSSDVELAEMKRRKLQLKDEIAKLKSSMAGAKRTVH